MNKGSCDRSTGSDDVRRRNFSIPYRPLSERVARLHELAPFASRAAAKDQAFHLEKLAEQVDRLAQEAAPAHVNEDEPLPIRNASDAPASVEERIESNTDMIAYLTAKVAFLNQRYRLVEK